MVVVMYCDVEHAPPMHRTTLAGSRGRHLLIAVRSATPHTHLGARIILDSRLASLSLKHFVKYILVPGTVWKSFFFYQLWVHICKLCVIPYDTSIVRTTGVVGRLEGHTGIQYSFEAYYEKSVIATCQYVFYPFYDFIGKYATLTPSSFSQKKRVLMKGLNVLGIQYVLQGQIGHDA